MRHKANNLSFSQLYRLHRLGGSGDDGAVGVSFDSSGRMWVAGEFSSTATISTTTITSAGGTDAVVFIAVSPIVGMIDLALYRDRWWLKVC